MSTTTIDLDAPVAVEPQPQTSAASRRIIAVLLLIIPLSQIGLDVYTPALPQMTAEFAASNDFVQNTVTAYMLGMSVAFLPVGLIAMRWAASAFYSPDWGSSSRQALHARLHPIWGCCWLRGSCRVSAPAPAFCSRPRSPRTASVAPS